MSLRLPMLAPHERALETCVYCPKLSRAACPVSNVEASETVTPWGKMSLAFFAARGDIPVDAEHAAPAWACTGCYACRERCDHKNPVATVLTDARADFFERGAAPTGAVRTSSRWASTTLAISEAIEAVDPTPGGDDAVHVLVGCGYARRAPEVARDALRAARVLVGGPVRAVRACCGLPLLYAGDRPGFVAQARRLAEELATAKRVVAVDPGCARALLEEYPRAGVAVDPPELFVNLAGSHVSQRHVVQLRAARVRYHDPCQLGRGLGRYDAPRTILAAITGAAPQGFVREREHGECSGGGGLLPVTRNESSRAMADARIGEHRARGGGLLVTACAQSLVRFRTRGEPAEDLVTIVARAIAPNA